MRFFLLLPDLDPQKPNPNLYAWIFFPCGQHLPAFTPKGEALLLDRPADGRSACLEICNLRAQQGMERRVLGTAATVIASALS